MLMFMPTLRETDPTLALMVMVVVPVWRVGVEEPPLQPINPPTVRTVPMMISSICPSEEWFRRRHPIRPKNGNIRIAREAFAPAEIAGVA